jgi:hypothetical protein
LPTQDATIWEGEESKASGSGSNLFVGNNNQGQARRTLLQFDIAAAVPAGATVLSVILRLTNNKAAASGTGAPLSLHALSVPWGEGPSNARNGGGGAAAQAGNVTWTWFCHDCLGHGTSSWRLQVDIQWNIQNGDLGVNG